MAVILRYYAEGILTPTASNWLKLNPYCLQQHCTAKNLVFGNIWHMITDAEIKDNECVKERNHSPIKSDNLINTVR